MSQIVNCFFLASAVAFVGGYFPGLGSIYFSHLFSVPLELLFKTVITEIGLDRFGIEPDTGISLLDFLNLLDFDELILVLVDFLKLFAFLEHAVKHLLLPLG